MSQGKWLFEIHTEFQDWSTCSSGLAARRWHLESFNNGYSQATHARPWHQTLWSWDQTLIVLKIHRWFQFAVKVQNYCRKRKAKSPLTICHVLSLSVCIFAFGSSINCLTQQVRTFSKVWKIEYTSLYLLIFQTPKTDSRAVKKVPMHETQRIYGRRWIWCKIKRDFWKMGSTQTSGRRPVAEKSPRVACHAVPRNLRNTQELEFQELLWARV